MHRRVIPKEVCEEVFALAQIGEIPVTKITYLVNKNYNADFDHTSYRFYTELPYDIAIGARREHYMQPEWHMHFLEWKRAYDNERREQIRERHRIYQRKYIKIPEIAQRRKDFYKQPEQKRAAVRRQMKHRERRAKEDSDFIPSLRKYEKNLRERNRRAERFREWLDNDTNIAILEYVAGQVGPIRIYDILQHFDNDISRTKASRSMAMLRFFGMVKGCYKEDGYYTVDHRFRDSLANSVRERRPPRGKIRRLFYDALVKLKETKPSVL